MGKRTDVMKILDNQKLPVTQAVLFLFRSGGIFIRVNIKSYTWFAKKKKKKTILKRTWKLCEVLSRAVSSSELALDCHTGI